jgi:hypothetical protein
MDTTIKNNVITELQIALQEHVHPLVKTKQQEYVQVNIMVKKLPYLDPQQNDYVILER